MMKEITIDNNETTETTETTETKDIIITGTNNRYLIKRANREKNVPTIRKVMSKYDISIDELDFKKQFELLQEIYDKIENDSNKKNIQVIIQEITKKINSYKQQDLIKKMFNEELFINYQLLVEKLLQCEMKCYYCKCEMFILYENVRELTQWSVDRIDNNKGHNLDNFVLACLNCNIKRRNKASEKFLFTKNLNIIKKN
uniref:HNH domain-containing protein n=1 Tax=viral metagenome TaxID=1070528 RepID=A0A6C0DKV5_9ZZZZ